MRESGGSNRRFVAPKIEEDRQGFLSEDHPAVVEGRTLFPSTVVALDDDPCFLVSGHNNPKLGKVIRKGQFAGRHVYHLTLEERATCPRSCHVWAKCYGATMPFARRHDHTDPRFMAVLEAEVADLMDKHPRGVMVRLHTLGDFFSVAYVEAWGRMLDAHPMLSVFGFTARSEMDDDDESRAIAAAVARLCERDWSRFAIRYSRAWSAPQGSTTLEPGDDVPRGTIVCPAQTGATTSCSTCGFCWAPAARDLTVAFREHGMKRNTGPREPKPERSLPMAIRDRQYAYAPGANVRHARAPEPVPEPPPPRAASAAARRLAQFDPMVARVIGAPEPAQTVRKW